MAEEDLLDIRRRLAENHGVELTPDEIIKTFNEATEVKIVKRPGLITALKRIRKLSI